MKTIDELWHEQKDRNWRILTVEDLELWAMTHDWLLLEARIVDSDDNIMRSYLTPSGNIHGFLVMVHSSEDSAKAQVFHSFCR